MVKKPEYRVGEMIQQSPEAREAYRQIKFHGFNVKQIRDWLLEFAPQDDYGSPSQCAWTVQTSRNIQITPSMETAIEPFNIIQNEGWRTSADVARVLQTWAEDLKKSPEKNSPPQISEMDRLKAYEQLEKKREEKMREREKENMRKNWKDLWENQEGAIFRESFKKWVNSIVEENEWIVTATNQPLFEFEDRFEAHKDFLRALKKEDPQEFSSNLIKPLLRLRRLALIYPYEDAEIHQEGRDEASSLHRVISLLISL